MGDKMNDMRLEYRKNLENDTNLDFSREEILYYNWKFSSIFTKLFYLVKCGNLYEAQMQLAIDRRVKILKKRVKETCYGEYWFAPDGEYTQAGWICKYLEVHYYRREYFCRKYKHYFGVNWYNCVEIDECKANNSRCLINQELKVVKEN